jgi:Spy/CpxP family protein refolding chaperone
MRRMPWLFGCCAMTALLLAGSAHTQDKKDDKKDDKAVTKAGTLPQGWSKIGLTADQKKKITAIRGTYAAKIDDLKKQIDQLKAEDMAECVKLLTDDQKAELKKILSDKIDGKDKTDKAPEPQGEGEGEQPKRDETAQVERPLALVARRQED